MEKHLLGKKLKMSQLWSGETVQPFTEVQLSSPEDLVAFSVGDLVKVVGRSKGKGFAGVVKRHHFRGGPATHGQSDRERGPGAIGSTTTPGRVFRGKKMAGRMGFNRVSLVTKIVSKDEIGMRLGLLGGVPGHFGAKLILNKI